MSLLTAEQASERAGTPYRTLLDWVTEGLFKPSVVAGSHNRRVLLFDEDDVHQVASFNQVKHRFERDEWFQVMTAIGQMRQQGKRDGYLGVIVDPETRKLVEYRPVKTTEIMDLAAMGALAFLVGLGLAALTKER